ncbi:hypothetical protein [Microbacterium sp. PRC9]|uniref:hypothetical protein n=1 Tax=Microbacterium sp. PRC9 TaxID=2962591 RepID=UPI002881AE9A|nr:hypothetical protein [Microbacterium sp. PRC9]MDT0141130.1 hypothetical protein [Microbacterium sp. PRC9]
MTDDAEGGARALRRRDDVDALAIGAIEGQSMRGCRGFVRHDRRARRHFGQGLRAGDGPSFGFRRGPRVAANEDTRSDLHELSRAQRLSETPWAHPSQEQVVVPKEAKDGHTSSLRNDDGSVVAR